MANGAGGVPANLDDCTVKVPPGWDPRGAVPFRRFTQRLDIWRRWMLREEHGLTEKDMGLALALRLRDYAFEITMQK
eukprot:12474480-Heterocapsa_arctica.AAC.1